MLDEPDYESVDAETRLVSRLRLADDIALIAQVDGRKLAILDHDGVDTINVASHVAFIKSLMRVGFVLLDGSSRENDGVDR